MSQADSASQTVNEQTPPLEDPPALVRQTVEFLVVLCLSILIFRTFAAEAYIVPTGSMAPTLLGNHREVTCPNCGFHVTVGLDEEGRGGHPVCPNCGQAGFEAVPASASNGDRVLVQKFLYDLRRPRRWEVAVFHFPGDPSQAYVKRVVGLPGESIQIHRGDVLINGQIARKSLKEQRAMRVLVYDHAFIPKDAERYPRWRFRRGALSPPRATGWEADGSQFVHQPASGDEPWMDWVEYRHWDPDRGRYAPVHDFIAYNGVEVRGENQVNDLMFEASVAVERDVSAFALRIDSGADRFVVEIPVGSARSLVVTRNRRKLAVSNEKPLLTPAEPGGRGHLVEASVMDRRLLVAVDGELLFEPIAFDNPAVGPRSGDSPIAFGIQGGAAAVGRVRIYRDVYYTSSLAFTPRRPFGIDEPFRLGPDDFFVLGDNSAVSNDSRFWVGSPVVPGELFLGKPFLVHLPGQAVLLKVFGRSLYWVPDPREIRYIR